MVSSKPSAVGLRATSCLARARMRGDVAQRLLGHAVQTERNVLRDGHRGRRGGERDLDRVLATELGAMVFQRGDQAGVLEHSRVQFVRQVTDRIGQSDRALLQPGERRRARRLRLQGAGDLRPLKAIDRDASCWLISSCSSRAIRVRSASWAVIRRPTRLWICS